MKSTNPSRLLVIGIVLALCGILITLKGTNKMLGIVLLGAGVCVAGVSAQAGRGGPRG